MQGDPVSNGRRKEKGRKGRREGQKDSYVLKKVFNFSVRKVSICKSRVVEFYQTHEGKKISLFLDKLYQKITEKKVFKS